jgi:hypothetical protein
VSFDWLPSDVAKVLILSSSDSGMYVRLHFGLSVIDLWAGSGAG